VKFHSNVQVSFLSLDNERFLLLSVKVRFGALKSTNCSGEYRKKKKTSKEKKQQEK